MRVERDTRDALREVRKRKKRGVHNGEKEYLREVLKRKKLGEKYLREVRKRKKLRVGEKECPRR